MTSHALLELVAAASSSAGNPPTIPVWVLVGS